MLLIHDIPYFANVTPYFACVKSLRHPVWRDSGRPKSTRGRFDILTGDPCSVIRNPSPAELDAISADIALDDEVADCLGGDLPFTGGLLGFYEYQPPFGETEKGRGLFGLYLWAVIVDHIDKKAFFVAHPDLNDAKKNALLDRVQDFNALFDIKLPLEPYLENISKLDQPRYIQSIETIRQHIFDGDCYQVNFTEQFSASTKLGDDDL